MKTLLISFGLLALAGTASAQGVQYLTDTQQQQASQQITGGASQTPTAGPGWYAQYWTAGGDIRSAVTPGVQSGNRPFCENGVCDYIPLEQLPGMFLPSISNPRSFGEYITSAFRIFIVLGGMFAVATFVFGGITYMTAEVTKKKEWARKQMQRAVYGILLLLGSFLLLTTINPELRSSLFNPANIIPGATQQNTTRGTTQTTIQPAQATQTSLDRCQQVGQRMVYTDSAGIGTQCVP